MHDINTLPCCPALNASFPHSPTSKNKQTKRGERGREKKEIGQFFVGQGGNALWVRQRKAEEKEKKEGRENRDTALSPPSLSLCINNDMADWNMYSAQ